MTAAINDLSIYGIFEVNFPKLVNALEHSKDHLKVELQATKRRIIELSGETIEEVYTNPLINEIKIDSGEINNMYTTKGI